MTPEQFTVQEYDFIIVGGGTAGLTLAARLTENENIKVGVIEAGGDRLEDPMISTPGMMLQIVDKPEYDWCFKTLPQKETLNRVHGWPRGKCLGGSSAINYMCFSQASRRDLDNWVELGNNGWGWDDLAPYYRKFETYNRPSEQTGKTYSAGYVDPQLRGHDGPVQVSFPENDSNFLHEVWPALCRNIGYPGAKDPRSGLTLGGYNMMATVDPRTATRSHSASAYYAPNAGRRNLSVITDALVSKVVFEKQDSSDGLVASGIDFSVDGRKNHARAAKEVIICCGTVNSPQLLELSGIGSRSILKQNGVQTLVENPGVGENLQDHMMTFFSWEAVEGLPTMEALKDPKVLQQVVEAYKSAKAGPLSNRAVPVAFVSYPAIASSDLVPDLEAHVEQVASQCTLSPALSSKTAALQKRQLLNPEEGVMQMLCNATGANASRVDMAGLLYTHDHPGGYVSLSVCSAHPFSRGSIHIQSNNPSDHPAIDPAYLTHPLDLDVVAHSILHLQKVVETEPLASKLKTGADGKRIPIPSMRVPKSLDEAKEHARANSATMYHPIGTCAMLPREVGGVVGTDLKVYGTQNVRVVDASVFPLHVQGNIVSLVYAVAEKAADMIKERWGT